MSKRKKIRIISFLSFILICLAILIFSLINQVNYYKNATNNNYQHAFSEFVSNFDEMNTALEKSVYSRSPEMLAAVCTQVYGKAQSAQMALGSLPFSSEALGETASFVSKVGDYSFTISKNAASGVTDESSFEILEALSDNAADISAKLREMYADISSGSLTIYDMNEKSYEISNVDEKLVDDSLLDTFKGMENEFPEVPSLIYDGPFSDDVDTGSFSLLEEFKELTYDQAGEIAAEVTGYTDLEQSGEINGQIKIYTFENNAIRMEITAKGGYIYNIKSFANSNSENIDRETALASAQWYLDKLGYHDMQPTYHMIQNNEIIINFAYSEDEYICYPDLIKVTVSLETGDVMDIDAAGYIRNHKDRDIPEEKYDISTCRELVPDSLKIIGEDKSIIPSYGKKEVYCYEFKCENDEGKHYIIYVSTQSGKQEDILILIEDETGTLAT